MQISFQWFNVNRFDVSSYHCFTNIFLCLCWKFQINRKMIRNQLIQMSICNTLFARWLCYDQVQVWPRTCEGECTCCSRLKLCRRSRDALFTFIHQSTHPDTSWGKTPNVVDRRMTVCLWQNYHTCIYEDSLYVSRNMTIIAYKHKKITRIFKVWAKTISPWLRSCVWRWMFTSSHQNTHPHTSISETGNSGD